MNCVGEQTCGKSDGKGKNATGGGSGSFVPLLRCRVLDIFGESEDDGHENLSQTATLTFWRPSEEIRRLLKEVKLELFLSLNLLRYQGANEFVNFIVN